MALKIRLARGGAKKRPFYRIVVAEAAAPRDGGYVERVGTYNPMVPKDHEQRLTLNGERINSCLSLAVQHEGDEVTTIEGLGSADKLHPMQAAFVKHDGYQCGYCTPGQICSAVAVLDEIRKGIPSHVTENLDGAMQPSNVEMRERMSGNICRCGAYSNIAEAMAEVAGA